MPKSHLLIIDGDWDTVRALKIMLEKRGYPVSTAHNINAASELVRTITIDLIICDICYPQTSGHEFIDLIRSFTDSPAIAMSAMAMPDDHGAIKRAGFLSLVTKPFSIASLDLAIQEALAAHTTMLNEAP
jgi:two-component system, OmpR family, KDP operon response regulator KdpE